MPYDAGNKDGKHYWLTPPKLMADLQEEFEFDFDACPYPRPEEFDGLTADWGKSTYVNPPYGSVIVDGKKKGPTAWARKAIAEHQQGKTVVLVFPTDKWIHYLIREGAELRTLGDVRWCATEDGSAGKGIGRFTMAFILRGKGAPKKHPEAIRLALEVIRSARWYFLGWPFRFRWHREWLEKANAVLRMHGDAMA